MIIIGQFFAPKMGNSSPEITKSCFICEPETVVWLGMKPYIRYTGNYFYENSNTGDKILLWHHRHLDEYHSQLCRVRSSLLVVIVLYHPSHSWLIYTIYCLILLYSRLHMFQIINILVRISSFTCIFVYS